MELQYKNKAQILGGIIMLSFIGICIALTVAAPLQESQPTVSNHTDSVTTDINIQLPIRNEVIAVKIQEDPLELLRKATINLEEIETDQGKLVYQENIIVNTPYVRLQAGQTLQAGTKIELSYPSREASLEDLNNRPIEATLAEDASVETSKTLRAQMIRLKFLSDQEIETQVLVISTYPNEDDIKRMNAYIPEFSNGFEDDLDRMQSIRKFEDTAKLSGFIITRNSDGHLTKHPVAGNLYKDQMSLHSVKSSSTYSRLAPPLMEMIKNYVQEYQKEKAAAPNQTVSKNFVSELLEKFRPAYVDAAIPLIEFSGQLEQSTHSEVQEISAKLGINTQKLSLQASISPSLGSQAEDWAKSARVLLWSNRGGLAEDNQQITTIALQPIYPSGEADPELAAIMLRYNPSFAANDFACEIATISSIALHGTYLGNEEAVFSTLTTPAEDLWTIQYAHFGTDKEKDSSFVSWDFEANNIEQPKHQKKYIRDIAASIIKMTDFKILENDF